MLKPSALCAIMFISSFLSTQFDYLQKLLEAEVNLLQRSLFKMNFLKGADVKIWTTGITENSASFTNAGSSRLLADFCLVKTMKRNMTKDTSIAQVTTWPNMVNALTRFLCLISPGLTTALAKVLS